MAGLRKDLNSLICIEHPKKCPFQKRKKLGHFGMEVYNLSQNISPMVHGNMTLVTSFTTLVNVLSEVTRSVKKHRSMHSTLYNLKAFIFPPTRANGFLIGSTRSLLPIASCFSH